MGVVDTVTSKGVQYEVADTLARNNMLKRSELPKNVSCFENDAGYIDRNVSELENFYGKSETYTRDEVDSKLNAVSADNASGLEEERAARESADGRLQEAIDGEAEARLEADEKLGRLIDEVSADNASNTSRIDNEAKLRQEADGALEEKIRDIKSLIPADAGDGNPLADRDFVNSSIATSSANFIGTFGSLEELIAQRERNVTPNDYAFVMRTDDDGNTVYDRYKYTGAGIYIDNDSEGEEEEGEWLYEYTLNNSSFTIQQWKAVNSGVTEEHVRKVEALQGLTVAQMAYLKAVINGTEIVPDDDGGNSMTFLADTLEDGDYTAMTNVGDFTLIALDTRGSDGQLNAHFTVDSGGTTVDRIKYVRRLKTNGAGGKDKRAVKFAVPGAARIEVVAASANTSEEREIVIADDTSELWTQGVKDAGTFVFDYGGPGGELYLYARAAVNFHAIYVHDKEADE